MNTRVSCRWCLACLLLGFIFSGASEILAQQAPQLVPEQVAPAPSLRATIDDKLIEEAERNRLRLFHGLFDELDAATRQTAEYALATWDLNAEILKSPKTPAVLRATAALHRGDRDQVIQILADMDTPQAALLRGQAHARSGRYPQAITALEPLRTGLNRRQYTTAENLTIAAQAMAELATLEGRPAADYQRVMHELGGVHQELDRLYWPALLAEARILIDKDHPEQAVQALHHTLALNPSASEAWYHLGRIALMGYNFEGAERAISHLRKIHDPHVLADRLEIEIRLTQKDAESAQRLVDAALTRYPHHEQLLALAVSAAALSYRTDATVVALTRFDEQVGATPLANFYTGRYLALARQYGASERFLRNAIALQPNWPQPHVELALMLNQAGEEEAALRALREAVRLDPFNERATNTLKMLEALAGYRFIETEHFIIKYGSDIDGALAADMPAELERIYEEITSIYQHRPARKTMIEIMPDRQWFAVRITGMPSIWTIGACTGPVIAITPPKDGKNQSGTFDWPRVMRHEFVHTVTLDQTGNRIPHWFTEACAVSQEQGPRDYATSELLAESLAHDALFDLEEINWAFVRPKKPTDRQLAYAQSHWMVEYITETYGHPAVLKMLALCRQSVPQAQIIPRATGVSAEAFLSGFKIWAQKQVESWGMAPTPGSEAIAAEIKGAKTQAGAKLDQLLLQHPTHPDLLRLDAERTLAAGNDAVSLAALLRYANARPIDPWADRKIAEIAVRLNQPQKAASHLEQLERLDQFNGAHAEQLSDVYRRIGQLDNALHAAQRGTGSPTLQRHLA